VAGDFMRRGAAALADEGVAATLPRRDVEQPDKHDPNNVDPLRGAKLQTALIRLRNNGWWNASLRARFRRATTRNARGATRSTREHHRPGSLDFFLKFFLAIAARPGQKRGHARCIGFPTRSRKPQARRLRALVLADGTTPSGSAAAKFTRAGFPIGVSDFILGFSELPFVAAG